MRTGAESVYLYFNKCPDLWVSIITIMPNLPMSATEQAKKNNTGVAVYVVAAIAGIITPGAYLLGYAYYEGYMNAFGVETDGFPVSAPNVYVFSYQTVGYFLLSIGVAAAKLLDNLLKPPTVYWVLGVLCLFIGGIYWLLKAVRKEPHPQLRHILNKINLIVSWLHWKNNDFTKSIGIVGVASYTFSVVLTAAAAIALFWWLLPLSANAKGKEVANDRIGVFREKGCHADEKSKWDNCFLVFDEKGNQLHEGLLIAMNDNVVAIFKKDGSYVFKRQDGFVLRRKLH